MYGFCFRKAIMKSLVETHPWLISEWHCDEDPQMYSRGCCKKIQWKCSSCGNIWSTRIQHRANGRGCPKCGVEKVKHSKLEKINIEQSLASTHKKLCEEWDESNKLSPDQITFGSNKRIVWKCGCCKHTWKASPNSRVNRSTGCPFCYGRTTTLERSLLFTHPALCEEWHDETYKTTDFSHGSGKRITWKCKICNHIWEATILNRSKGRGCPICDKSIPVRKIIDFLQRNSIPYKTEYRFSQCKDQRTLPFDFAILKDKKPIYLIEYQGRHHFMPIWGDDHFDKTVKHDEIKKRFCATNSIPLIEITECDLLRIEDILMKANNEHE